MANASARVDMIGADEARYFLVSVIGFIGQAARSDVPGQPLWVDLVQFGCHQLESIVPGDAAKAFFTPAPDHGDG